MPDLLLPIFLLSQNFVFVLKKITPLTPHVSTELKKKIQEIQ